MASTKRPGIKVVDFAYPSTTAVTSPLSPIPEIFNQHIDIAEVEHYWAQCYRTYISMIPAVSTSK
jgi:hypothetical protein